MKKLVLFDVDGILIKSVSLGIISDLIKKNFGLTLSKSVKYYTEGKTYRKILSDRLKEVGIAEPEKDERFERAMKDTSIWKRKLEEGIKLEKISNVEDLIKLLIKREHIIGLLTGNPKEIAKVKLDSVGLWKYFKVGAFGSESKVRADLIPLALKHVKEKFKIDFSKKDVFLIGDTLEDINCAKIGGVRIIAVATGKEPFEQLILEKPNFIFRDFSDVQVILDVIENK